MSVKKVIFHMACRFRLEQIAPVAYQAFRRGHEYLLDCYRVDGMRNSAWGRNQSAIAVSQRA